MDTLEVHFAGVLPGGLGARHMFLRILQMHRQLRFVKLCLLVIAGACC